MVICRLLGIDSLNKPVLTQGNLMVDAISIQILVHVHYYEYITYLGLSDDVDFRKYLLKYGS